MLTLRVAGKRIEIMANRRDESVLCTLKPAPT